MSSTVALCGVSVFAVCFGPSAGSPTAIELLTLSPQGDVETKIEGSREI